MEVGPVQCTGTGLPTIGPSTLCKGRSRKGPSTGSRCHSSRTDHLEWTSDGGGWTPGALEMCWRNGEVLSRSTHLDGTWVDLVLGACEAEVVLQVVLVTTAGLLLLQ